MNNSQRMILLGGMLVTFVLGSIHSFSVFLVPLEQQLEIGRATASLLYSFGLIFLTISVLFGYLIYHRLRPGWMILMACLAAALGLLISSRSNSWWMLWLGYSVLFGTANGVGYGYALQLVGRAIPKRKGLAMASVTAAYAVGSVVFSITLARIVSNYSTSIALSSMAAIVAVAGVIAALLMVGAQANYDQSPALKDRAESGEESSVIKWWLAYGCSVFAGLMAIGHAAGIVQSLGGVYETAVWGAVWIGVGSAAGGFIVGVFIRPENIASYLLGLPLLSAMSLLILGFVSIPGIAITVLAVVGFAYGALIAVYPYAIAVAFGDLEGPKIYGRVFTAWGFAGLAGPWCAGRLFDFSGTYSLALLIAALIAFFSSYLYWSINQRSKRIGA